MRVKNVNLKWNVLLYDCNNKKVENYNIFYQDFVKELHKEIAIKKNIKSYDKLYNYIRSWAMYHYWSKCEFEIVVGDFPTSTLENLEKIDVYRQIEMNLDRITEYVIKELRIDFK